MTDPAATTPWTDTGRRRLKRTTVEADPTPTVRNLSFDEYSAATNGEASVLDLVRPIVVGDDCLIVTGYQDFLSTLSIIMELRPGITHEPPDTIRILFGTNTDNLRAHTGPRQPLPEHARRHYTTQSGVFARDMRDLKAVQALEAIRSGAIRIRVFDEDKAAGDLGRAPGMMHANLFVNNEFAVAGSANFSRRGMSNNVEFNDRVVGGLEDVSGRPDPHEERRRAGETFWSWGRDWSQDAIEILGKLLRNVDLETALGKIIDGMSEFSPWRPVSAAMSQHEEDAVYMAARTLYEHGAACVLAEGPAARVKIGRSLAAIAADMYERSVLRDDETQGRKQGSVVVVSPLEVEAWRHGRRGALRIVSQGVGVSEMREEIDNAAVLVLGEGELNASRHLAPSTGPDAMTSFRGGFTVALGGEDDPFRGFGQCLRLLEDGAALHLDEQAMQRIATALESQLLSRTCKRPRRSSAKLRTAMAEGSDHLSTFLCGPRGHHAPPTVEVVEVSIGKSHEAAFAALGELIADPGNEEAEGVLREIFWGMSLSARELRERWRNILRDRLGARGGASGAAAAQGQLPMFAELGGHEEIDLVETVGALIEGKALAGLDASRGAVLAGLAMEVGRLAVIVERQTQVKHVAEVVAAASEGLTFAFGYPQEEDGIFSDRIVAAGETVAHRVRHLSSLTELREKLSEGANCAVVLSLDALRQAELQGVDAIALAGPLPALSGYLAVAQASRRAGAQGRPVPVHCLEMKGVPGLSGPRLKTRVAESMLHVADAGVLGCWASRTSLVMSSIEEEDAPPLGNTIQGRIDRIGKRVGDKLGAGNGAISEEVGRSWGADVARIEGAGMSFTAYFLTGKTGRRGEAFMPPRLVVVRHGKNGDEIIRGQVACLSLIDEAVEAHQERTRSSPSTPNQPLDADVLLDISGELAEITHWDIRPERVRVMVRSLAEFLEHRRLDCDGATVLGDLSLPSLEMLADRWLSMLGTEWSKLKERALSRQIEKGICPEMVDLGSVESAFLKKAAWEIDRVRKEMSELVEDLRFADREKSKTVQDRVSVIIRATP